VAGEIKKQSVKEKGRTTSLQLAPPFVVLINLFQPHIQPLFSSTNLTFSK